jgi:hypothetical protein
MTGSAWLMVFVRDIKGCNSYDWGMSCFFPFRLIMEKTRSQNSCSIPGKVGEESAAARFAAATPSTDFSIQNDRPYAEV